MRPDDGMYGIKLILPPHLEFPWFIDDFDGTDGRQTLMNFRRNARGRSIAENIPLGHKALVYCTSPLMRFIWAIEFIGTIEEGERTAAAHRVPPNAHGDFMLFRPIRITARVPDYDCAPTPQDIFDRTGIEFTANSFTHTYIAADQYQEMFDAIFCKNQG